MDPACPFIVNVPATTDEDIWRVSNAPLEGMVRGREAVVVMPAGAVMDVRVGAPDVLNVLAVTLSMNVLLGNTLKDDGVADNVRVPGLGGGLLEELPPPHETKKNAILSSAIADRQTREGRRIEIDLCELSI